LYKYILLIIAEQQMLPDSLLFLLIYFSVCGPDPSLPTRRRPKP